MSTPESTVLHAVMDYLMFRGALVFRNNTGVQTAEYNGKKRIIRYGLGVGSPDIVGVYRGRFIGVEAKAGRNKPTEAQAAFLQSVRDHGGIAIVVTERDYCEVIDDALGIET